MMYMIPKIETIIVVTDDKVEEAVKIIIDVVRTGSIGRW